MTLHVPQPFTVAPVAEQDLEQKAARRLPLFDGRSVLHVLVDLVMMWSIMLAITILIWGGEHFVTSQSVRLGGVVSVVVVIGLGFSGLYGRNRTRRWPSVLTDVMRSALVGAAVFSFAGFFVAIGGGARRWLLYVVALWTLGLCLHHGLRAVFRSSINVRRVIVAGPPREALSMRAALRTDRRNRYQVVGFVLDRMTPEMPRIVTDMALGSIDELPELVDRHDADQVMFCLGGLEGSRFAPLARLLNQKGVDVALTGLGDVAVRRVGVSHVQGRPVVSIAPAVRFGWRMVVKRIVDIVISLLALIVLSPVLIVTALAVKFIDGQPPIFKQERVGKGGRLFEIYKFRSMVAEADHLVVDLRNDFEGPIFKMDSDPRTTRIGRFIRKTSIDECPQLFNVLKGEMSLVGPRPFIPSEVEAAPASFRDRELVTPGMTGRWQVSGRSDTDFDQLDELDRWYVDNWSLGEDLQILAKTVPAVLLQRGAR